MSTDAFDNIHWTWFGNNLVTCNPDGTIPLNSKIVLTITDDTASFGDELRRSLIASAPDLFRAARRAHAALERCRPQIHGALPVMDADKALDMLAKAMTKSAQRV